MKENKEKTISVSIRIPLDVHRKIKVFGAVNKKTIKEILLFGAKKIMEETANGT